VSDTSPQKLVAARSDLMIGGANEQELRVPDSLGSSDRDSRERGKQRPATIGLCMIVRNEVKVITRCLDSVRPVVDYVLIEDTGSTDGTQQLIAEWLKRANMPGLVIEEPWRDFAYNRSHVLAKLREVVGIDYALIIDADDHLVVDEGAGPAIFKAGMREDLYDVQIRHGGTWFYRPQLCANRLPFCFKAVVHEYLEAPPGPISRSAVVGFHIETGRGGARSQNPNKYQEDAGTLANAIQTETDPFLISRYTFYLAQSYRDCGDREKALENYLARATLGFWQEEVFVALYQAAQMKEHLAHLDQEVIDAYLRAADSLPARAEALHGASRFCRYKSRHTEGYQIAKRGLGIPVPSNGLFVEPWIYEYGLLDEFAVHAYWAERYQDCLDTCERLLRDGKLSEHMRERIEKNAGFARKNLAARTQSAPEVARKNSPSVVAASADDPLLDKNISFNISLVSINGHDRIFDDTVRVIVSALNDLGYPCSVRKNAFEDEAVNIVLGSTVFAAEQGALAYFVGRPHILYQLEQLKTDHGYAKEHPEYLEVLKSASYIVEYSPSGVEFLQRAGLGEKTVYLPPSFHKTLEVFVPVEILDIDVLFVGSHSPRRAKIINDLRNRGVNAVHAFGVYGEELIHCLRRSKIVINIHALDSMDILETVRISFLLANRCFVISETSDHNPYGAGVVYADYEALVSSCLDYLGPAANQRAMVADEGYVAYRRSSFASDLRDGLLRMPLRNLLAHRTTTGGPSSIRTLPRSPFERPALIPSELEPYLQLDGAGNLHTGVPYIEFLKLAATRLNPGSYLEIGTETGASLRQVECDALCIDPTFQLTQDALLGRKRTFLFQMTSDEFFSEYDPRIFFPRGVDLGFLDGLHHFEALLRDFINFERCCHENSVAIIHDCLPTDLEMTSRQFKWGGWTGDVWRILPALKKYRPDLRVLLLDCPPTGLVVCFGLDSSSTILQDNYKEIIEEFSQLTLDDSGLQELRSMFPFVDSRLLLERGGDALFFHVADPRDATITTRQWSSVDMPINSDGTRALYLDLLIKCVSGSIHRDPNMSPWGERTYDPARREVGADWPTLAHTMIGTKRLQNLRQCVETVIKDAVPGDFIETGVWRGGACILMRGILTAHGIEDRKVYVADSFAGLPPASADYPADAGDRHHTHRELTVSLDEVQSAFQSYGLLDKNVIFVKGWFRDTLPALNVRQFAVIRLDGDMYESTVQAIEALYPRLSPGGFIIIDDYGAVPGCRQAVDDYRLRNEIATPMRQIDWAGWFWRKPD
jgi:glycosyltransferase involved in cell wall biosynthesis